MRAGRLRPVACFAFFLECVVPLSAQLSGLRRIIIENFFVDLGKVAGEQNVVSALADRAVFCFALSQL
jgi:hypothetical protein